MPHVHLNAREWLESLRLVSDCRFIPELLDILDGQDAKDAQAAALEGIEYVLNQRVRKEKPLFDTDPNSLEDAVCSRLDLLESLEEIISENLADMTWLNGTVPIEIDDKLRAAFDSERWLTYDL